MGGLDGIRTRLINLGCHGQIFRKVPIWKFKPLIRFYGKHSYLKILCSIKQGFLLLFYSFSLFLILCLINCLLKLLISIQYFYGRFYNFPEKFFKRILGENGVNLNRIFLFAIFLVVFTFS
jgi:hypothetical protein